MALEQTGSGNPNNWKEGHIESMDAFVTDHLATARGMQNISEGRKMNAPLPPYDPKHPDNQWPVMIYHPTEQPMIIGRPVYKQYDKDGKEIFLDDKEKKRILAQNDADLKAALAVKDWQTKPYLKPNVRLLTPDEERASLLKQIADQNTRLAALADTVQRMSANPLPAAAVPDPFPKSTGPVGKIGPVTDLGGK